MEISLPDEVEDLSSVKKLVYTNLAKSQEKTADLTTIAKACKLIDIQVIVSIQLLSHKKMLPTEKMLF